MSLPSYIINWDELSAILEDAFDGMVIRSLRDIDGIQRALGFAEQVSAIQGGYNVAVWKVPTNILLTGITFAQSAWKPEDRWDLWIDEDKIFEDVYTKEFGDEKYWQVIHPVKEGQIIKLVLHNDSGNSRDVWIDIDYVELIHSLEPPENEPKPPEPTPEPTPPEEPHPPTENPPPTSHGEVVVCAGEIVEVGVINVPSGTSSLELLMEFSQISGASFPDLNVIAPNGDRFGYKDEDEWEDSYVSSPNERVSSISSGSCSSVYYSGFTSHPESMIFSNPMAGEWSFFAQSWGGDESSRVKFSSNIPFEQTYEYKGLCDGETDLPPAFN